MAAVVPPWHNACHGPIIAADQISYEDLYARWEQGNWRALLTRRVRPSGKLRMLARAPRLFG